MSDILSGWLAYVLMNNNVATFIFVGVLLEVIGILIWVQFKKDTFDLRAIYSTYQNGQLVPDTSKSLLVGTWIVSSYLTIEHYSDAAVLAYLTAWVINGGFAALAKYQLAKDKP
jgi:hypothetical protein